MQISNKFFTKLQSIDKCSPSVHLKLFQIPTQQSLDYVSDPRIDFAKPIWSAPKVAHLSLRSKIYKMLHFFHQILVSIFKIGNIDSFITNRKIKDLFIQSTFLPVIDCKALWSISQTRWIWFLESCAKLMNLYAITI